MRPASAQPPQRRSPIGATGIAGRWLIVAGIVVIAGVTTRRALLAARLESVAAVSIANAAGTYGTGGWQGLGVPRRWRRWVVPVMAAAAHPTAVSAIYPAETYVANRVNEATDE